MELDDDEEDIICYKKDPNRDDWKIALPDSMVNEVVHWFHTVLGHPGRTRMRDTLQARYHSRRLRSAIDQLHCQDCQRQKLAGKGYGLLPELEGNLRFLAKNYFFRNHKFNVDSYVF